MPKLNAALLSSALPNLGLFGAVAFPNATKATGVATAAGFTYSEVGNFSLGQYAVYDDGFTAVDSTKANPECTSNFNNGPVVNGRYGCMFGSIAAGPFGRFVPHHFTVMAAITNACPAGSFTYMGQPFTFSQPGVVEARNAGDVLTQNYRDNVVAANDYAPGTVSFGAENADNGTDLSARLAFYSLGAYPALSGSWVSGVYTLTGNDTGAAFRRPAAIVPDATWGPFDALDLGLTVADSDVTTSPKVTGADMDPAAVGGANLTYRKFFGSPLRMRYGRLRLPNAFGPETEPVIMPARLEFYNGTAFALNTQDDCTNPGGIATYQLDNTLEAAQTDGTILINGAAATTLTIPITTAAAGLINLRFSPPGAGNIGNTDVTALITATLPWLLYEWDGADNDFNERPTGRVNFGIYRGNDRIINWREIIR
jgi:MSHA biogenesis protein MshQ